MRQGRVGTGEWIGEGEARGMIAGRECPTYRRNPVQPRVVRAPTVTWCAPCAPQCVPSPPPPTRHQPHPTPRPHVRAATCFRPLPQVLVWEASPLAPRRPRRRGQPRLRRADLVQGSRTTPPAPVAGVHRVFMACECTARTVDGEGKGGGWRVTREGFCLCLCDVCVHSWESRARHRDHPPQTPPPPPPT